MHFMSGKLSSLSRRLSKVERQLIGAAKQAELANCNCRELTVAEADKPEEFEAQMNENCPAHGFRRLGLIIEVRNLGERRAQLDQLLTIYRARPSSRKLRLSQVLQAGLELR
jgi:hypothetical protein